MYLAKFEFVNKYTLGKNIKRVLFYFTSASPLLFLFDYLVLIISKTRLHNDKSVNT